MEGDSGAGGGGEALGEEGGGRGIPTGDDVAFQVLEGKVDERAEELAAPPAVEEELQTLSRAESTEDDDSGAWAEGSGLAVTGDGGAAASEADLVSALFGDKSPRVNDGVGAKPPEVCECFVGGLPPEATEGDLMSFFVDLDPLSARVSRRKRGGDCKGYGFVVFPSAELAERACGRKTTAGGRVLGVELAVSPRKGDPTTAAAAAAVGGSSSGASPSAAVAPPWLSLEQLRHLWSSLRHLYPHGGAPAAASAVSAAAAVVQSQYQPPVDDANDGDADDADDAVRDGEERRAIDRLVGLLLSRSRGRDRKVAVAAALLAVSSLPPSPAASGSGESAAAAAATAAAPPPSSAPPPSPAALLPWTLPDPAASLYAFPRAARLMTAIKDSAAATTAAGAAGAGSVSSPPSSSSLLAQ